jgi:hydrogenase/urease accessory protein HupE
MGRGVRCGETTLMSRAVSLLAAVATWLAFAGVAAHPGGTTGHATVSVAGQTVRYALVVPADSLGDAARDLREFAATLARHVKIEADGAACSGVPAETRPPSAGRASAEIVVLFACKAPMRALAIQDGISVLLGTHYHTLADIQWPGGARQVLFDKPHQRVSIDIAGSAAPGRDVPDTFLAFVGLGVEHIVGGIDHLLFLVALLALSTSLWQTVKIVTAFTVAHSVTLSLASLGLVNVPASIVEPLIAASIVWVAVENLVAPAGLGRRWLVAAVFGLIHGLGFASALAELELSRDALARALVGFNIGVELGQLAFVVVVMPLLIWGSRPGRFPRLPQFLSVVVALTGAVWFIERIVGA